MDVARISDAVDARLGFAGDLFDAVHAVSTDTAGVTRPAWSPQDQQTAEILGEAARGLGLAVSHDPAGNLWCRLPGRDAGAPMLMTGSHLDSVPTGGHYDGLAGFIAGLTVLAAFKDVGVTPACDIVAIGTRGEESVWYGVPFLGARLATGSLDTAEIDRLTRGDTGRTLADHMAEIGLDPEPLRSMAAPPITATNTRAFLELHIEQGPVLVGEDIPVGIPTTIRGSTRFPYARCLGRYDHSGATPRAYRSDAVLAVTELVSALDAFWIAQEEAGVPDTVFTVGKLFTDAAHHAMTKVPGACDFTLNFGGTDQAFLDACHDEACARAQAIAEARRVTFVLGECIRSKPAPLDETLRGTLRETADALGIATRSFATVGHDAAVFTRAGIPAAMVLVRNAKGSHNPDEEMALDDFGAGTKVLAAALARLAA